MASYYFIGQTTDGGPIVGTTGTFTGAVTAASFSATGTGTFTGGIILGANTAATWVGQGQLLNTADGKFTLRNNGGTTQAVGLQIGNGTADAEDGTTGLIFGTTGSANAVNLVKTGAGSTMLFQTSTRNTTGVGVQAGNFISKATTAISFAAMGTGGGVTLGTSGVYNWSNNASGAAGSPDTGFARTAAATIRTSNASTGVGYFLTARLTNLQTTSYSVLVLDSGSVFQNTGAVGQVVYTLPASAIGLTYTINNTAAGATFSKIVATTPDIIVSNGVAGAAAGSLTSTQIWSSATIVCTSAGIWQVTSINGTWTLA